MCLRRAGPRLGPEICTAGLEIVAQEKVGGLGMNFCYRSSVRASNMDSPCVPALLFCSYTKHSSPEPAPLTRLLAELESRSKQEVRTVIAISNMGV